VAHHKSAKKRAIQSVKKRLANKIKTSAVKTQIKKLRVLIETSDKAEAQKLFPTVQGMINKLAKSSALKKQAASRKTSRLAAQIAKL
jgi:small subunit ribosomal protein S20